jgi:hypothetical protein
VGSNPTPSVMKLGTHFVRYGIPGILVLAGFVCLFVANGNQAAEGWALFTGAGLAVLIVSLLLRIGVEGDRDRDREEEARDYFSEHGRWPGE